LCQFGNVTIDRVVLVPNANYPIYTPTQYGTATATSVTTESGITFSQVACEPGPTCVATGTDSQGTEYWEYEQGTWVKTSSPPSIRTPPSEPTLTSLLTGQGASPYSYNPETIGAYTLVSCVNAYLGRNQCFAVGNGQDDVLAFGAGYSPGHYPGAQGTWDQDGSLGLCYGNTGSGTGGLAGASTQEACLVPLPNSVGTSLSAISCVSAQFCAVAGGDELAILDFAPSGSSGSGTGSGGSAPTSPPPPSPVPPLVPTCPGGAGPVQKRR
jgi:hypothetical protein